MPFSEFRHSSQNSETGDRIYTYGLTRKFTAITVITYF